jgi:hypothetical protein
MLICVSILVDYDTAASMILLHPQEVVKNVGVVHRRAVYRRETCHSRSIEVRSLTIVACSATQLLGR